MWLIAALAASPAAAQLLLASTLAGVTFPIPSNLWVPDALRSQAAALDRASALIGRACGPTEFHIWDALGENRDAIRMATDTAFAEAGWSPAIIDLAEDGDRVYQATRGDQELVMVWLVEAETIGLVMCLVTGPRVAGTAGTIADPTLEQIPLPRPRPDPDAPVVVVPGPAAAETPPPAVIETPPPEAAAPAGDAIGDIIAAVDAPAPDALATAAEPAGDRAVSSTFSIWMLLVAIGLGVASFFLVRWGRASARAIAGAAWPTAVATVVYSDIAAETRPNRRGGERARYVPVIAYEYEVDGMQYRAARLRFGDASRATLEAARELAERFPVGAGIEIRYDPRAPGDATIEADPDRLELRLIGGIALAVLAAAALINALG